MDEEDTSRLVPESAANLWKVVREKTDLQRFGSGIKITCICLALVIMIAPFKSSNVLNVKRFICEAQRKQHVNIAILGFECL